LLKWRELAEGLHELIANLHAARLLGEAGELKETNAADARSEDKGLGKIRLTRKQVIPHPQAFDRAEAGVPIA
jgi:hypothetical protein